MSIICFSKGALKDLLGRYDNYANTRWDGLSAKKRNRHRKETIRAFFEEEKL